MLKKLLKHEWKSIWKIPMILIAVLLVASVMAGATFAYPFWESTNMSGLELLVVMIWMMFYFIIIAVSVGISIYLAVHFYKSMYTDEGYLTHTLPVTSHQLLISKILPMAAWIYLAVAAIFVAILIFGGMAVGFTKPAGMTFAEFAGPTIEEMKMVFAVLGQQGGTGFILSMVLMLLISGLSGAMMVVGSVTIGQLVSKHKILGSVGAYFAINMITNLVSTAAMIPIMIKSVTSQIDNVFEFMTPSYLITTLIVAVIAVALYFISELIIRKKLNLD